MSDETHPDWFSEETATFGDRLSGAREAAGMSQKALAQRLGVKTAVIEGWENDTKEPRANRLSILSGLLNVSLRWLLTGVGRGPDLTEEDEVISEPVLALMSDMRVLRAQIAQSAETLGQLEKRLRKALRDQG